MKMNELEPWSAEAFEAQLRARSKCYHIHHPYQMMMNEGLSTREQIQAWVANRYYYQVSIPIKDAAILANCPDREVRRHWVQRILDHDGYGARRAASRRGFASARRSG
jgi:pyrroloquinoline-quinone synthase